MADTMNRLAPDTDGKALTDVALRGSFWFFVQSLLNKIFAAGATLVIAYFLSPEQYGLAGSALAIAAFLRIMPPELMGGRTRCARPATGVAGRHSPCSERGHRGSRVRADAGGDSGGAAYLRQLSGGMAGRPSGRARGVLLVFGSFGGPHRKAPSWVSVSSHGGGRRGTTVGGYRPVGGVRRRRNGRRGAGSAAGDQGGGPGAVVHPYRRPGTVRAPIPPRCST